MDDFRYRIERLTDTRLSDVQCLLEEVMGKRVSLDYLRTKYGTQYTGHQYMSSIAYDGDRPVAFYGTVPQEFEGADGEAWVCCHLSDCMTLESYRRKGLHRALGLTAYEWMRAAGIAVVYGFHSENTYHSSKKLDWLEWGQMRGYWLSGGMLPVASALRRVPLLHKWWMRRLGRVLGQYEAERALFHNSQRGTGMTVRYSEAFFASKGFHSNYWIVLEGVRFWLSFGEGMRVGDVHFDSVSQMDGGLRALRRLSRRLGYRRVLFQTYRGSPLDVALASRLPGFDSWIVGYLPLVEGVNFLTYRLNYGDQDSF